MMKLASTAILAALLSFSLSRASEPAPSAGKGFVLDDATVKKLESMDIPFEKGVVKYPAPLEEIVQKSESFPWNSPHPMFLRRLEGGSLREAATAYVWIGGGMFNMLAVLEDSDVFSSAQGKNDTTWDKGDVLELFVQSKGAKQYCELHVAPSLGTLEILVPSVEDFRGGRCQWGKHFFNSGMKVQVAKFDNGKVKGWVGSISIPLSLLGPSPEGARFCVCRYNYNHAWGPEPELSSLADFPTGSYHNPPYWRTVKLLAPGSSN